MGFELKLVSAWTDLIRCLPFQPALPFAFLALLLLLLLLLSIN
jgi:hypothetical protein